jgi:hypothetical protein
MWCGYQKLGNYFYLSVFVNSSLMQCVYVIQDLIGNNNNSIVIVYCTVLRKVISGFGGLEVASWPLVPKFAGSNPAEAVGLFGRKNPQHAFLRRGSKAVCPMSCFTACKRTQK